jgi:hypothetical protein
MDSNQQPLGDQATEGIADHDPRGVQATDDLRIVIGRYRHALARMFRAGSQRSVIR